MRRVVWGLAALLLASRPAGAQGLRDKISELFVFTPGQQPLFLGGTGVHAVRRDGHRRAERGAWVGQGITYLSDPGAEGRHRLLAAFLRVRHPVAVVGDQVTRHRVLLGCRWQVRAWSEPGPAAGRRLCPAGPMSCPCVQLPQPTLVRPLSCGYVRAEPCTGSAHGTAHLNRVR